MTTHVKIGLCMVGRKVPFLNKMQFKYVDIDASHCKFKSPPQFATSLTGDAKHWSLTGTGSVTQVTLSSFRVVVIHPDLKGMKLLLLY